MTGRYSGLFSDVAKGADWFAADQERNTLLDADMAALLGLGATSASSHSISTGSKAFVLAQTSREFQVDTMVRVRRATDATTFVVGVVTAASAGNVTINVPTGATGGSGGPYTNWILTVDIVASRGNVRDVTGNDTQLDTDDDGLVRYTGSGGHTQTLLAAATAGSGFRTTFRHAGSGAWTVGTAVLRPGQSVTVESNGTTNEIVAAVGYGSIAQGRQSIWLDASVFRPRETNGPEIKSTSVETSTNKIRLDGLAFDQSTVEYAQARFALPKKWDLGTITFKPYWMAASGSGDVIWRGAALALSDNDTLDTAVGTAQSSTDTLLATTKLQIAPESSAITIAGSPAAEDLVVFELNRNASSGSDTLSADAVFLGCFVYCNLTASTDD